MDAQEVTSAILKGTTSEEITGVVSVLTVKPKDVLIFQIEVGRLPHSKINDYLNNIKASIKTCLPEGVQTILVPSVNGQPQAEITVLRYEQKFGEK